MKQLQLNNRCFTKNILQFISYFTTIIDIDFTQQGVQVYKTWSFVSDKRKIYCLTTGVNKRCLLLVGSMAKELEGVKKKRRFMRKSVTDTLKLISEALAKEKNHARIQVLKDSILNKWNDLTEILGVTFRLS